MDIMNFIKDDLEIKVKVDEDGGLELNLEDVSRGLGFIKIDKKNGKEYVRLNKQIIKNWLINFGILNSEEGLPEFIPENIFYRLCIKADNKKAIRFQNWMCDDVLPSLRKNSFYIDEKNLDKEKFEKLEKQFEKLKLTMFDICEMGKISLGKASELLLGNKHELKERFVRLGWLDYDKCQVVQRKFKASNNKIYELFVYNVSGTYDKGKVSQQLQVSLTNAGFIWLKDRLEQDKDFGKGGF